MNPRINTVKEVVKPLGRPGYAIDFPIETDEFKSDELNELIGKEVYVQTKDGPYSFIGEVSKTSSHHYIYITDISSTKIYGHPRYKTQEIVEIELDNLSLLEWNETVVKRIAKR